ncbi:MAG: acyltransferase family protein [Wujia sp.]
MLGFFAVLIVFHHIAQTVGAANASAFVILEDFGVGLVGMFFFFSGYGLMRSLRTKPDYLKGFFRKRLPGILIPFYVCVIIFVVAALLTNMEMTIPDLLGYLSGFILINTHMWYIVEIALFYTVFYLLFRFIKDDRKALLAMGIFLVVFTICSLALGHGIYWFQGEWWYNTSLVFLVGMLFAKYETGIFSAFRKHYRVWLTVCALLFLGLNKLTRYMLYHHGYWTETMTDRGYADKFMTLAPQLAMTISFVVLVVLILMKCKFDNPVLRFLGNISLELYLIHNLFLTYCKSIAGTGMYVLVCVSGSIILAALLHALDTFILCKVHGTPVPKHKPVRPYFDAMKKQAAWRLKMKLQYIRRHPKRAMTYVFRTLVCVFISFVSVVPIYILYINATRTKMSLVQGVTLIPEGEFINNLMDFQKYAEQIAGGLYMAIFRTCFIAGCSCLLAVYFGCMCAYGFELFSFRGKKILWKIIIASLMFSQVASFCGFYHIVGKLGLLNSMIPLIIPAIATPSVAYFMRMYLRTLHLNEIVEAARIDGCSELGIYNRIILPSVKPAVSLQIIFTFVTTWNNSFMQSMILQRPHQKTISMILRVFAGDKSVGSNPMVYVVVLLTTIPPVIVYILFSKSIVSRIVLGAVKE